MYCIVCSSDTKVTNSRPHKKTPSVWRRRACKSCGAVFTTREAVCDNDHKLVVVSGNHRTSFSFPRLMVSINNALVHRDTATSPDEAYWLAQTISQQLYANPKNAISLNNLVIVAYETIKNFDTVAAVAYGAKHGLAPSFINRRLIP